MDKIIYRECAERCLTECNNIYFYNIIGIIILILLIIGIILLIKEANKQIKNK